MAREEQRESDVEMGADAQGIGELGQEGMEARRKGERERFERDGPGALCCSASACSARSHAQS